MSAFVGTKRLTRLALRRDRISMPVTLVLVILMTASSFPALSTTYPSYDEQLAYVVASVPSVVGRLFQGVIQGPSLGTIVMAELYLFTAVILAVMSIFIVTRHTRYNEETGAAELISSTAVGRSSPLTVAMIEAIGANIIFGIVIFLSLLPMKQLGTNGSLLFSLSLMMCGIFFAGVAAITAQLSDYRRGANMMAIGTLVASFIVFGIGNAMGSVSADGLSVSPTWLSWLSPLGWGYLVLPWTENRIWPLLILVVATGLIIGGAYFLLARRDEGSSIFPSRAGRPRAKTSLLRTGGLTRLLQRPSFLVWLSGFVMSGMMVGLMVNSFREIFEENEVFQQLLSSSGLDGNYAQLIIATMFPLLAAMLAGYVVTAFIKTQDEEGSGRIEQLLSTALSRGKWLLSHIWTISLGIIVSLAVMGIVGILSYWLSLNNAAQELSYLDVFWASMASVPAMLLFMAIIIFVFAVFGKFVKAFAWVYYAYCTLIGSLAGIFSWPDWVQNLSPFKHTPAVPAPDAELQPLFIMSALTIGLVILALVAFRRRDLNLK